MLSRRRLVRAIAIGLLGSTAARAAGNTTDRVFALPPGLQRTAARLGQAYLRLHPHLNSRADLLRELGLHEVQLPSKSFYGHITRRIRNDFDTSSTVVLNGWLLSRTEAAACALIALG